MAWWKSLISLKYFAVMGVRSYRTLDIGH